MVAFKAIGRVAGGLLFSSFSLSLAACGGRTSAFDDGTEYGTGSSLPSDGGNGAATSDGGSRPGTGAGGTSSGVGGAGPRPGMPGTAGTSPAGGSVGTGGVSGAGQAGFPGTGATAGMFGGVAGAAGAATGGAVGIDAQVEVACTDLCINPETACLGQFGPQDQCFAACTGGLGLRGGNCEALGLKMVSCINQVVAIYLKDCAHVESRAQFACARQIDDYQSCAFGSSPPAPPVPPGPYANCSGGGSASPGKCAESMTCENGQSYSVSCYDQGSGVTSCNCTLNNVTASLSLNESTIYACQDALAACGAPVLPK